MSETGIHSKVSPDESNSNGFSNAEPIKSFLVLYAFTAVSHFMTLDPVLLSLTVVLFV